MSANQSKKYPGYRCVGIGQAAGFIRAMINERDPNKRARLASHALLLLSDADKAIGGIAGIVEANDKYHGLLQMIADAGITLIPDNPEEPLSLGGEV